MANDRSKNFFNVLALENILVALTIEIGDGPCFLYIKFSWIGVKYFYQCWQWNQSKGYIPLSLSLITLSIHTNNSHHRFHAKLSKRTEIRLVTRYDGHLHGDSELDSPRETTRSSQDPCKVKTSWSLSFIHPMQKWMAYNNSLI